MSLLTDLCNGKIKTVEFQGCRYEPTGEFRPPVEGEVHVSDTGGWVKSDRPVDDGPRIILKPADVPPRREACHGIRAAIDNIADSLIAIKGQLRKIE